MKAHRTDGVSLTFALIFLGITAWWLFAQLTRLTLPAIGWLVAAGLIGVGALGLIGALRANRSGRQPAAVPDAAGPGSPAAPTGTSTADTGSADASLGSLFEQNPAGSPHGHPTELFDHDTTESFHRDTESFDRDTTEPIDRDASGHSTEPIDRDASGHSTEPIDRDAAEPLYGDTTERIDGGAAGPAHPPPQSSAGEATATDRRDERPA
ncbi:hypothetical protein ABNF97_15940 [Plantactinospora sp. B6F1]|uniref:hypothetical protein n=1 Tax=Plantactinospora sp. B6F1 TaxID=3158971 RepID=UPI0010CE3029